MEYPTGHSRTSSSTSVPLGVAPMPRAPLPCAVLVRVSSGIDRSRNESSKDDAAVLVRVGEWANRSGISRAQSNTAVDSADQGCDELYRFRRELQHLQTLIPELTTVSSRTKYMRPHHVRTSSTVCNRGGTLFGHRGHMSKGFSNGRRVRYAVVGVGDVAQVGEADLINSVRAHD